MEDLQRLAENGKEQKEVTIKVTQPSTNSDPKETTKEPPKQAPPTRKWIMNQMRNAREITKEGHRWSVPTGEGCHFLSLECLLETLLRVGSSTANRHILETLLLTLVSRVSG